MFFRDRRALQQWNRGSQREHHQSSWPCRWTGDAGTTAKVYYCSEMYIVCENNIIFKCFRPNKSILLKFVFYKNSLTSFTSSLDMLERLKSCCSSISVKIYCSHFKSERSYSLFSLNEWEFKKKKKKVSFLWMYNLHTVKTQRKRTLTFLFHQHSDLWFRLNICSVSLKEINCGSL